MILYFSGVAGKTESQYLNQAGVRHVLVDQVDLPNAEGFPNVSLDSGAYRAFKKGSTIDIEKYKEVARQRPFDFRVAVDTIGDADTTLASWRESFAHSDLPFMPVWQWGGPVAHLHTYLDQAPLVGIGSLVSLMRAKDAAMLKELTTLCRAHPQRFHIFGINWLKAIETLKDLLWSADTSKWLDGGRYGHVIFVHTKTGHLQQCPARFIEEYRGLDRKGRCITSAQAMRDFVALDAA